MAIQEKWLLERVDRTKKRERRYKVKKSRIASQKCEKMTPSDKNCSKIQIEYFRTWKNIPSDKKIHKNLKTVSEWNFPSEKYPESQKVYRKHKNGF